VKAIYKYLVPIKDVFTVDMPDGAAVLSVQVQFGEPKMWALVDNSRPTGHRHGTSDQL